MHYNMTKNNFLPDLIFKLLKLNGKHKFLEFSTILKQGPIKV